MATKTNIGERWREEFSNNLRLAITFSNIKGLDDEMGLVINAVLNYALPKVESLLSAQLDEVEKDVIDVLEKASRVTLNGTYRKITMIEAVKESFHSKRTK